LTISEKSAQIGKYGIATSLCVIAMEELSKSVILELRAINNSIPIKNFEKYFTRHDIKHMAGISLFSTIESKLENSKIDFDFKKDSDYALAILVLLAVLIVWVNKNEKTSSKKNEKTYFDLKKESGFYVDYNKQSRQWTSPSSDHKKEEFEGLYHLVIDFSEKTKKWIFNGKLEKEKLIEFLYSLDDDLIDKSRIEKLI
jgi:AbiV family abortive infection protein